MRSRLTAVCLAMARITELCAWVQAPLLPLKDSAATDEEVQMTGMVGQCVRGLAQDCREPSVLLEAVASTLRSADPGDPQAAILSVKAANIVIGCLEPVRRPLLATQTVTQQRTTAGWPCPPPA